MIDFVQFFLKVDMNQPNKKKKIHDGSKKLETKEQKPIVLSWFLIYSYLEAFETPSPRKKPQRKLTLVNFNKDIESETRMNQLSRFV